MYKVILVRVFLTELLKICVLALSIKEVVETIFSPCKFLKPPISKNYGRFFVHEENLSTNFFKV